jgi:predicted transposase/invertase (TIGR01784 family)
MITRYLDPKNDLAFHKIFGSEKYKSIPIDFLNAVFHLTGEDTIIDLEFLNPKQPPEIAARKESIVDVLVHDQRGIKYIIEMQVAKVEGFEKRAQYYAAKTYCAHFGVGHKYHDLKKVIFLAITDYIVFPKKADYKSDHVILDNKTYENDLKDFSFTFVELPKFSKTLDELQTIEDKWYYFLKHADESSNIAEILAHHPEIKEAYELLDRYYWNEAELHWYDKNIMNIADEKGIIDAAKNEGRNEGIKEGKNEGDRSARVEIAKAMIKNGLPMDQITACTNLTLVEIYATPLESPEFPMKLQETPYMLDLIDGEVWEEVK